ncbi:hypothetical protein [Streptosporangium sp. NPDC000396]|uniref:hypothetical protein n=1 Tax=Streptosporangium sp. NPDC000396 TaxID=3366185 RepID=UPI0036858B7B
MGHFSRQWRFVLPRGRSTPAAPDRAERGVTFARRWSRVETPFAILAGLGIGAHNIAILLRWRD